MVWKTRQGLARTWVHLRAEGAPCALWVPQPECRFRVPGLRERSASLCLARDELPVPLGVPCLSLDPGQAGMPALSRPHLGARPSPGWWAWSPDDARTGLRRSQVVVRSRLHHPARPGPGPARGPAAGAPLQQSCEKRPEPGASRQVAGRPGREHSSFCADALPVPAVTFRPRAGLRRTSPGRPRSDGGPSRGPSARLVGEGAGAPPGLDAGYGGPRCQRAGRRRSATTPPRCAWAVAARTWCATAARPVLNTLPPPAYSPRHPPQAPKRRLATSNRPPPWHGALPVSPPPPAHAWPIREWAAMAAGARRTCAGRGTPSTSRLTNANRLAVAARHTAVCAPRRHRQPGPQVGCSPHGFLLRFSAGEPCRSPRRHGGTSSPPGLPR